MRLLAVRGYLAWRNGLDAMARLSATGAGMGNRLTCAVLRRVDYRLWLEVRRRLRKQTAASLSPPACGSAGEPPEPVG